MQMQGAHGVCTLRARLLGSRVGAWLTQKGRKSHLMLKGMILTDLQD